MSLNIKLLKPHVQQGLADALMEMKIKKIDFCITSGFRTEQEQYALYCQGRESLDIVNEARKLAGMSPLPASENTYTVTKCDGKTTKSPHQSGLAVDIVPAHGGVPYWPAENDIAWAPIAQAMKAHGFKWGGEWESFRDCPHYQMEA